MRLLSLNVRSNPVMDKRRVVADISRARRYGDVICFQEITGEPDYYRRAVRSLGKNWQVEHDHLDIPIAWRSDIWRKIDSDSKRMHKGKPKASPHRYLAWVILEHVETGERVAVFNTHMVSGAWNDKPKHAKAWRKRKWRKHRRRMARIVRRFRRRGYTCIGAGDFNRLKVRKFHRRMRWLSDHGIDKIWCLRGKRRNGRRSSMIVRLNIKTVVHGWHTDHPGKVVYLALL